MTFPPYFNLLNWQKQDFSKQEGKKPIITVLGENPNNHYLSHNNKLLLLESVKGKKKSELFNTKNSLSIPENRYN